MDWTNIVCVILSAIIGPLSIAIVTAALKKQEKKIELRAEEERLHEAKLKEKIYTETKSEITETVSAIVENKTSEFKEDFQKLSTQLDKVSDGTLSTLRNDILTCYYRCRDNKFRTDYDYQNIHHMYDSYKELNGNSYVNDVITRFDNLPTEEDYKAAKQQRSKSKKNK